MRRNVTDTFLNSLLLLVLIMVPSLVVGLEPIEQECIILAVDTLLCLYWFMTLSRAGAFRKDQQEPHWKHLLILSPVFIVIFAIPLTLLINPDSAAHLVFLGTDATSVFLTILRIVLIALIEEMAFRIYFYKMIRKENRLLKIVISAGIYALFDLIYFFHGAGILSVLISMIGSFLLGLILGALIEYGHCIYVCMGFHLLYSFFGSLDGMVIIDATYLIVSCALFILAICYLIAIYIGYFREKEYDYYVQ